VCGQALAHVAQTEVQLFRLYADSEPAVLDRLTPLVDPMLQGVHQRWLEHELAQADTRAAELRGGERLPGAVEVSLLFCDLKGFTTYAETKGDAAAVGAIERFAALVDDERGDDGHVVKVLGDGYMLAYPHPGAAVAAGSRMIERAAAGAGPELHASVHHGVAVFRDGDYFGHTVNVAARLLDVATAGELLATEDVARSTAADFKWSHVGLEHIRGLADPLDVWRLNGPHRGA
jgi:adenylate cyclase